MNDIGDISLNRASTAEQVAELLLNLIMSGTLKAGQPLRENSLAASMGISRNSLREGVRLLEQSRLVRYELHRGTVVAEPSVNDLKDLYLTRMRIESAAVAIEATAEQVAGIRAALDRLVEAGTSQSPVKIVASDLDFHMATISLLGSRRITDFYTQIKTELTFYLMVLSYTDQEFEDAAVTLIDGHRRILEAIEAKDTNKAVELVKQHISENLDRLLQIFADKATS